MQYDILIVGGGIVGQTFACALAKLTPLSIGIIESQPLLSTPILSTFYHHRVSAITLSSHRIFKALELWEAMLQRRVSAFTAMEVSEVIGKKTINFDCREVALPLLGYIIENNVIQTALQEKIKEAPHITLHSDIIPFSFSEKVSEVEITTTQDEVFKARLVIAADGSHSWLRQQAGIKVNQHHYQQNAIVTTVETTLSHQQRARQVFLEGGPLAFLPLKELTYSSIVWSMPQGAADEMMQLTDETFKDKLAQAFSNRLGEIINVEKRVSFPLYAQQAKQYVESRVVLVGDAAHTIHPLAGQGINLGLLDAVSLAEIVAKAHLAQSDFADIRLLRRYERWRKADNFLMQKTVHLLNQLFTQDKKILQQLRSFGMNFAQQTEWLKRFLIRYAVGDRIDLPLLAKN